VRTHALVLALALAGGSAAVTPAMSGGSSSANRAAHPVRGCEAVGFRQAGVVSCPAGNRLLGCAADAGAGVRFSVCLPS
jgi:hypothetical protein